jgi:four helix bundle protein
MGTWRDLVAYKKSFSNAMQVFDMATKFPEQERFMLTSQIVRSSRSVCANLVEAYRKRQYKPHFISKISDADAENSETLVWLEFALACGYINESKQKEMTAQLEEVGRLLNDMMQKPEKYIGFLSKG